MTWLRTVSIVLVFISLGFPPPPASAQSPGSSESATVPSLAQELTSTPIPGQWSASSTVGAQLKEGRTTTVGVAVNGILAHTTRRSQIVRLDVETNFGKYRSSPAGTFRQVENNQQVQLMFLDPLRSRVSLIAIGAWRRDTILALRYRVTAEGGVGFHLLNGPRVTFLVAPTFAVGAEDRKFTEFGNGVLDYGILQSVVARLPSGLRLEMWLQAHMDAEDPDDRSATFNASAIARITRHLALKVYYQHQYDGVFPPGSTASDRELGVGLQVSFERGGKP